MANPNTIDWLHYQDIQIPDSQIRNKFNQYMTSGQYIQALALLHENEAQVKGKAFIAETINKIITGVMYLEKEFDTNVHIFLTTLGNTYRQLIENLRYKQFWTADSAYTPYNFAVYKDEVYMCISNPPVGTLPTDTNHWLKIGLQGEVGAPGIGVQMKYSWKDSTSYEVNDVVAYQGDLYIATKPNQNSIPSDSSADWMMFILTIRNGIYVSLTEPERPQNNTVWFQTEVDPTIPTSKLLKGKFYRYNPAIGWEIMYPMTVFNLLVDKDDFQPKATVLYIFPSPNNWINRNNKYVYSFVANQVLESSYVRVMQLQSLTAEQYAIYSGLGIEVEPGSITLTSVVKPDKEIALTVIIQ